MIAALHHPITLEFIRAVLTVRHTITHLVLLNALPPMCTLELACRRKSHDHSFGRTGRQGPILQTTAKTYSPTRGQHIRKSHQNQLFTGASHRLHILMCSPPHQSHHCSPPLHRRSEGDGHIPFHSCRVWSEKHTGWVASLQGLHAQMCFPFSFQFLLPLDPLSNPNKKI